MNVCRMLRLRMSVSCACVFVLLIHTSVQTCSKNFVKGRAGFVLNTEESVAEGASYLSNASARTPDACVSACCQHPRCNLALMEAEDQTLTNCFLFDCLYRNQFVCSFYRKSGFSSHLEESVYEEHLRGPGGKTDKHPIAIPGPDVVTRAGKEVTLNGIESWDDKNITQYEWTLLSENLAVQIEKSQFVDQRLLSNLHPGVYRFQLTVTDSAGQTDRASITVLVLTQEQFHCLAPVKVGPCRGSFPRWHFNAASGVCERFTFGGCKPNNNNYLSEQECVDACEGTTVHESRKMKTEVVCHSSCEEGQFVCSSGCCVDSGVECDGVSQCGDGSDEKNCPHIHCLAPVKVGPCRGSFPRWHFNAASGVCERFTFGGCKPNNNNYLSEQECVDACEVCNSSCEEGQFVCSSGCCVDSGVECDGVSQCSDGSDEENCQHMGPCRGSFPRWHFNAASGVCERFTFGGCKPNNNNYLSEQECVDACEVCNSSCEEGQFVCSSGCCVDSGVECDGVSQCSDGSDEENCQHMYRTLAQLLEISVNEEKARCVDPPVTGPCRASMPHWFYDPLKQSCFRFTYGGCRGNRNRFVKEDECVTVCSGVSESDVFARGLFERAEEVEKPHTGSVATGVIIMLLILVLIGLAGCYFVRNRKKKSESERVPTAANL